MSSFDRILLAKQNEVQNRKSQSAIAVSAAKLHFRTTQALDTDTAPSETDTNTYGAIANESRRFVADSPIVNQDRDVNKHEDGTYSITTAEGKELVGLDELTARSYSAWNQEDFRAKQAGASDSWGKNTANAIGQTVSNIGVTAASATAGYTTLAEQVGYENYVSKVRQGNKYDPATELTEQDIAKFQSVKDGKGSENAASREFAGTDKFKTMERLSEDAAVNKGQVDNIKKFGEEVKKFIPVNRKEQVAAHTEFKTIAKNEGIWEATKHTMFNNLDVLGQQGIESVPYMIAFTVGGPVTQASILSTLAVGKGQEAIQEFVTKNRREPTAEESTRIKAWSVVATVAEKFGDMAVTRAIPAAQLKWFTKVKDQVTDSIPTSIATLPSVKASQSILTKGVLRPAIALAGEGQSGAITAVSEQLAQDGKITDTSAIAYDALAEAFGTPGGVAAIVTAKTVTRATKGAIEGVSNERNNRSRATELRAELAKPSAFADTPEADEVRNRIAEIDQEIQGNDLTTVAGTATAPINVVELSAERSQLQAQLDTLDEGSITAEERKAAQAEYDALPIRLRPEAKPAPTERKSNTEDKVEDTPEPTEEISPEDFQAALDKIKLTSESSQEDLDALKALRTGYKLTEAQTTARRAKAAEVAALAKKTSDSNAAEEAANEGKPKKGSFDIITVTGHTPEELDAAEAKATKEGKPKDVEHVKTLRTANELEEQLDKVEKDKLVSKTQAAVNTEVLDGTSDRWVGMNTYFSAINEAKAIMNSGGNKAVAAAQAMKSSLSKMTTHVGNIRAKHNALVSALSAASKGKPVFVRGDRVTKGNEASREMKYTRQPDMTEAQFKEARANGEYVFRIDANSKKLVDAIGQEAKYGDAMLKVANGHKDTSYAEAATNKQRADAKLAKDIADLNNDSDNLTDEDITDSDLDAIDAEEKANDSSKDEAPADKTSSTDSDGDTSSEENSVKPTTVDADSAATESVSEQSAEDTIETKEDKLASTSEEASTTEAGEVTPSDIFTDSELGNMDNILGVSEEDIQGYIDNSDSLAKAIDELNNTDVREDGADAQAEVQQELDYLNKIQDYMQNQREAEGERSSAAEPVSQVGDNNTVFTQQMHEDAIARLRKASSTVNSGVNPLLVKDLAVLAGFYLEHGSRVFTDYAKHMLKVIKDNDLNDIVYRPLIAQAYELNRKAFGKGMTAAGELLAKYEVVPGGFANKQQKIAIDRIGAWLKTPYTAADSNFVLEGRGGTGKTAVLQKILDNAGLTQEDVAYTATTNKAKAVLAAATGYEAATVWTALGMKPPNESDVAQNKTANEIQVNDEKNGLDGKKILVIDEASMLGESIIRIIAAKAEEAGVRVLYLGDSAQMAPIRTTDREVRGASGLEYGANTSSEVFNESQYSNRVRLIEPQRQLLGSPILAITEKFTKVLDDGVALKQAIADRAVLITDRVTKFNEETNSGVIFTSSMAATIASFVKDYAINPLNTRMITAYSETNTREDRDSVYRLNRAIFSKIHGDSRTYGEHAVGDVLMSYGTVKLSPEETIWNASEYEVMSVGDIKQKSFEDINIPYQLITLRDLISNEIIETEIPAVTDSLTFPGGKNLNSTVFSMFAKKAQELGKTSAAYAAYTVQNADAASLANMKMHPAFVLTAWKAQGSTYRNVYVIEDAFNENAGFYDNQKTSYHGMYVATSRPTDKLVLTSPLNTEKQTLIVADVDYSAQDKNVLVGANTAPAVQTAAAVTTKTAPAVAAPVAETAAPRPLGGKKADPNAVSTVAVSKILPVFDAAFNFLVEAGDNLVKATVKSGTFFAGQTIVDLVKITKGRSGIFSIPANLFPTDTSDAQAKPFIEALVGIGLSETTAREYALMFVLYNAAYQQLTTTESYVTKTGTAPALRAPQRLLEQFPVDAEGNLIEGSVGVLPPQAVFALMVGVDNFQTNNNSDSQFGTDRDKANFIHGTQRATLSAADLSALQFERNGEMEEIGLDYRFATQDIGPVILGILGMSATNADTSAYVEALGVSLGALSLEVLNKRADIPGNMFAQLEIITHKWDFGLTRNPETGVINEADSRNFVQGEEYNHIKYVNPPSQENRKENVAKNDVAVKLLSNGVETETGDTPLQDPPKTVTSEIRNSFGGVPEKMRDIIDKMQKVVWGESDTLPTIVALAVNHTELLHTLMNFGKFDKYDVEAHAASVKASNDDKIKALKGVLEQQKMGHLKKFYYRYKLMNQHRMMQTGNVNAQSSHFTRHMVNPQGTTKFTSENIHMFKYAVMFNLGYKVDKNVPTDITKAFDEYLKDPDLAKAVQLLQAETLNEDALAEVVLQLKTKTDSVFANTDISLLTGLIGLAKYRPHHAAQVQYDAALQEAKANGTEAPKAPKYLFESGIPLEIDGVSNGFAINVFQFPKFDSLFALEKHLNQTGTYLGKTDAETTHLESGIHDPESAVSQHYNGEPATDSYLDLGALVQRAKGLAQAITYYTDKNASAKFLNYVESTYEGKSAALDQLYPDLADEKARDLVKYPFMIFLYGGGIQSISEGVAKQVIAYLYESMGTLRRDYAKDPSEANEKAINDFTAHLATLNLDNAGALNTALKTGTRLKNFSINEDQLISDIGRTLEPRFDSGLNAMLGDTKKLRDGVTQSAEIMHAVFMYHYNKAVTAEKVRLKRPETGELTNAETLALIKKSVKQWLPQYKGPLMSANETSFVDLSKRISTRTSSTANRVTTTVRNFTKTARNPGDTRDRVNEPKNKEFTSPSVSALIRGIINMDATLLALSLDGNPNVLALYDAVFGRPEDLMAISETYNDNYMKYGMETSVADIMRNRVEYVLNQTASTAGALDEISADLEETAHVNQFPDEDGPKNLQKLRDSVNEAADDTVESRAVLAELIKERGARTWQLFAAAMAATNLGAGQSVDSRVGELRSGLNSHINKIVMSLVDRMSPAVKSRYTSLMSEGVPRALEVLQAYTPEHAKAYINIAQDRTVIKNALDVIKSEFKGESFKAEEVLVNLLQDSADHQTRNEQLAGKIDTAAIEAELSLYAVPTDFSIESDTATAAERAIVDEYNSLDNLRRDNEKTVFAKDITESSINALFNKFTSLSRHYYSSKEAADKHTEGLQRVMSKLSKGIGALGRIRIQVEKIDGITQGNYDATRKRVRVSLSRQVPGARNEYSPQEVYVHEVLHAMTVTAINSNKLIGDRIRKVRAQAKNNIDKKGGYKTFLTHITGTPTQDEVDLAKHQYNYLFGKEALNVPEEFLAYAVTNPTVMGVLESFDTALPDRGDGLVAKIQQIIDMVLEQFARVMGRKVNANAYEEMLAITEQLIEIQSGHQSKLDILETKTSAFMNKADKAFKSAVLDTVSTVMAKDDNGLGIRTLAQAAIGGAVMALGTGAAANTVTLAAYTSVGGVLESALKEMGEGVLTKPLVKALLHTKANISKLHQQVEMDAVRRLDASWKSTTPDAIKFTTRKAITRVLYRTDLSSLITDRPGGMTHAEVSKILSNPDMIKAEKKRILKAANIRSGKAIKHAQELGYFIATKRSYLSQGHFNVHSIAGQYLNSEDITPQNIDALNAIATLTALQHQKEGDLKLVSELMSAEIEADPTENGLQYMLDSHRAHVGQSLTNLFHGNPIQMQKGYTVERIDNLTDMRTGVNTKEEAKLMAREGYNEPYDMGDIPGVKQAHTVMYISRTTPEIRHVSGILSTTGLHHSGTLLSEVIGKDPKFQDKDKQPDRKKIRAEVAKLHRRESGLEKKGERDYDQRLRPIRDENNKIVDYRIIMNSDSVEKLFQPDMEFQDVFAHMNSSYVNKKNTVSADKDTVDILVNEWVGLQPSIPDQFINIMDPESKYFERYLKMPEEVRKYMQQYTVNGEFMVRENIIDKVFGYPAKDMSRSPLLQGASMGIARNVARKFNYGLRQVMAFGMERIVMATLMVITKNIESNIYHLGLRKIGPRFIANKMQEGLQAYERYETDTRKLRDLYHEIQMATGAAKTALQRELAAVEIEVENNAIHKISSAGLQNLIVEDVNTSSGEGYMRRMHNMLQTESIVSITDKMPTTLTEFAKNLVLARSSYIYRKHKQSVQLTDFLGRYVMIQHAVEVEGRPFDEVLHESIDAFVLFDENMHPWLEAINSMGFTAFLSYFLRNTRAARQSIQKSPVSVMTAGGIQATLDIDAMAHINSSIFLGKMLPNSLYQDELLDAATTIHGIENFTDVLGLLD